MTPLFDENFGQFKKDDKYDYPEAKAQSDNQQHAPQNQPYEYFILPSMYVHS